MNSEDFIQFIDSDDLFESFENITSGTEIVDDPYSSIFKENIPYTDSKFDSDSVIDNIFTDSVQDESSNQTQTQTNKVGDAKKQYKIKIKNESYERSIEKAKKIFKSKLKSLISLNDFEYGFKSKSEEYVENELLKNKIYIRDWLNSFFNESFAKPDTILAILRICGHLEYSDIEPQGVTMAIAAVSHKDSCINEAGLRCFENWCIKENLPILKNTSCRAAWLEDFRIAIIKDIEDVGE